MSHLFQAGDQQSDCFIMKTMDILLGAVGISHACIVDEDVITTYGLINCVDPQDETSDEEYDVTEEQESIEYKVIPSRTFGKKGKKFGQLEDAVDIKCWTNNKIIVTDLLNNKIQIFSRYGKPTAMYVAEEMIEPWGMAVTPEVNLAVVSSKTKSVSVIDQEGNVVNKFGNIGFQCPSGIAVTDDDHYVITDSVANTVSLHDVYGELIDYLTNGNLPFKQPRYVTVSPKGEIIVSDSGNHCLEVFDRSGKFVRRIGRFGREEGCFRFPRGVCTDSSGNIFVADHYNNRISVFSETGEFSHDLITSDHGLLHPQGVTISNSQHLYITHGDLKASQIMVFKLRP